MNAISVAETFPPRTNSTRRARVVGLAAVASGAVVMGMLTVASPAHAAEASVGLGTTDTYSVLGALTVTSTGATTLSGDLGVSPGTAVTGFPPGIASGTIHAADAAAGQAQLDLTTAYNDAAGRAMTQDITGTDLGGLTLTSGVYTASSSAALTGTLTLNAQGDPTAAFIFQVGSTLTTASSSSVSMINGGQPCNVFWQVGSSATLGTGSTFIGTIMALTSVTVTTGATVEGRALASTGAVTLDTNVFTAPRCNLTPPSSGTTSSAGSGTSSRAGGSGGTAGATSPGGSATGASTSPGSGSLAETGTPRLIPLLGVAALLIAVGTTLPLMGRSRRRPRRQH